MYFRTMKSSFIVVKKMNFHRFDQTAFIKDRKFTDIFEPKKKNFFDSQMLVCESAKINIKKKMLCSKCWRRTCTFYSITVRVLSASFRHSTLTVWISFNEVLFTKHRSRLHRSQPIRLLLSKLMVVFFFLCLRSWFTVAFLHNSLACMYTAHGFVQRKSEWVREWVSDSERDREKTQLCNV